MCEVGDVFFQHLKSNLFGKIEVFPGQSTMKATKGLVTKSLENAIVL